MKRNLLIAMLLGGLTASTFAQGVISVGITGKIKYTTDGATLINVPAGNPAAVPGFGNLNIAVYSASNGTVLPTSGSSLLGNIPDFTQNGWKIQTSAVLHQLAPSAGTLPTTAVTLDAASGGPSAVEQIEVVGWTGSAANFGAALTTPGTMIAWMGSLLIGGGSTYTLSFATGDGVTSTPILTQGAAGFNGLVLAPIPEPGTMLLGGLGAAALLLFRRRK